MREEYSLTGYDSAIKDTGGRDRVGQSQSLGLVRGWVK